MTINLGQPYLDVVAAQDRNSPIHNHELGMKGPKDWSMVIEDLQIDMRYFIRMGQTDILARKFFRRNWLVVVHNLYGVRRTEPDAQETETLSYLLGVTSIIHDLDDRFLSALARAAGQFSDGIGNKGGRIGCFPVVRC